MAELVYDVVLFIADWLLGVLSVHEDVEKLTGTLNHKRVFLNFNVFLFYI